MIEDKEVILKLSAAEAIVLSEWICRFNSDDETVKIKFFEDQAEQRVLWNIECDLEKALIAPMKKNYREILEEARSIVRDIVDNDR